MKIRITLHPLRIARIHFSALSWKREDGDRYRFAIISSSLLVIIRLYRCLGQILTIDYWDIPGRQITEARIEFAGNWFTKRIEFGFGSNCFGIESTGDRKDGNELIRRIMDKLASCKRSYPSAQ